MLKKYAFLIAIFCIFFCSVLSAESQDREKIESFRSTITVNTDSTIGVSENIRVFAIGDKIKHGIYRDFPTRYKDPMGFVYYVGFDVDSVTRDGQPEEYFTKDLDNGVRVYIGDKNAILPNYKSYDYVLNYRTDRQLFFTSNYTELYWNVTGNGWDFPIEKASVDIILPKGAAEKAFFIEAYTGPEGSKDKNFKMTRDKNGIHIRSTVQLGEREGFTVLVRWPSGYVTEPAQQSRMNEIIRYNKGEFAGIAGLLAVLLYYIVVWLIAGKDPKKGTIVPLFEAPDGLSPAAVRFITKMGYDNEAFAAAIVSMAVKGYLKISDKDGEFSVTKTGQNDDKLSADEKKIADAILDKKEKFVFKQSNHTEVSEAVAGLKTYLKNNYEKNYFIKNAGYFAVGLLLTLAAVIGSYIVGKNGAGFFILIWLTFWTMGLLPLMYMMINSWGQAARSKGMGKALGAGGAVFLTLFSLPFLGAEIFVGGIYLSMYSVWMMIIIIGTIVLNLVFYHLMKAPTSAGRKVMDKIDGFKMFLSATEKDRMEKMMLLDRNMVNFEKFLPYAIALGVEKKWSEQFQSVLENAQMSKSSPSWYSGSSWTSLGAAAFVSSLGSSLSGAVGSSSVSSSSGGGSGGGGGSSGGGGGGGGGGGW